MHAMLRPGFRTRGGTAGSTGTDRYVELSRSSGSTILMPIDAFFGQRDEEGDGFFRWQQFWRVTPRERRALQSASI